VKLSSVGDNPRGSFSVCNRTARTSTRSGGNYSSTLASAPTGSSSERDEPNAVSVLHLPAKFSSPALTDIVWICAGSDTTFVYIEQLDGVLTVSLCPSGSVIRSYIPTEGLPFDRKGSVHRLARLRRDPAVQPALAGWARRRHSSRRLSLVRLRRPRLGRRLCLLLPAIVRRLRSARSICWLYHL